jgi:hypothetical protein
MNATKQPKQGIKRQKLLIANAGGYWGDDPFALRRQVESQLDIHYVSIDYLAEITMSILQKQRARDPRDGYAKDFVTQITPLLHTIKRKGIRIITNAGGVNPRGCAEALFAAARREGVSLRVALVEGDDVKSQLGALYDCGNAMAHMDDGRDFVTIRDHVLSANAYFGAKPVVAALAHEPDIVLCGRVTDTGITLAALMHEFGWAADDYNRLASGIVAGHIIECGAQATGGNFTDWRKVPSFRNIGYPVVECSPDGSFAVTKAPGSGGLVSCQTVREQLLYEMGEPASYITPDVIADFSSIQLREDGPGRVVVSGVTGRPPTDTLKLSISYADGFKIAGTLIISGPDALAKAQCFSQIFWEKLTDEMEGAKLPALAETRSEFVGFDSTHGPLTPSHNPSEILLRLAARDATEESLKLFRKLLPSMILSGPSGVAVTGGAPVIQEIVSYWPALLAQQHAPAHFVILELAGQASVGESARLSGSPSVASAALQKFVSPQINWDITGGVATKTAPQSEAVKASLTKTGELPTTGTQQSGTVRVPLMTIAHARSGDKGDTANIGLIGRSAKAYEFLRGSISAQVVKNAFGAKCLGTVRCYPVPNLWALNFLLERSLGGGGTMSLHLDAQGKTFSQALLRMLVDVPKDVVESIAAAEAAVPGEITQ